MSRYKVLLVVTLAGLGALCGILSQSWWFWLALSFIVYVIEAAYFSRGFQNILNLHFVAISLVVLYAVPSTVLILQGRIALDTNELLLLFSSVSLGLIGYTCGVLLFRGLFPVRKESEGRLLKKIEALFWVTYKYRYVLAVISFMAFLGWGVMPRSMSYTESIVYRMQTPGIVQYCRAFIPSVFSVLVVSFISIIGDLKKRGKLTCLSYLMIALTLLSIVMGYRSWIIGLFACLLLAFQTHLKRRHLLIIIISAAFMAFIISGGVRYARSGGSFTEIASNFTEYLLDIPNRSFTDLMWGWDEFTGTFSTFITVIKHVPSDIEFDCSLYGKDLALLLPTVMYAGRPLSCSEWYVKTFEPEVYEIGGGRGFYILGAGYLFAGPPGVLFHLFLFGALFECVYRLFRRQNNASSLFLYSYFFAQLFTFVHGGNFFGFIKTSVFLDFLIPISFLCLTVLVLDALRPGKC